MTQYFDTKLDKSIVLNPLLGANKAEKLFSYTSGNMRRIHPYNYFAMGVRSSILIDIKEGESLGFLLSRDIYGFKTELASIADVDTLEMKNTAIAAKNLLQSLDKVFPHDVEQLKKLDIAQTISADQAKEIGLNGTRFDHALATELAHIPHFMILNKGIYSVDALIETPLTVFPEFIISELSEYAKQDIIAYCKAYAFELATAAGFHIARATEAVLKQYVTAFAGNLPKGRDWGKYVAELNTNGADKRITNAIDRLRELHRNPLMHPDDTLTMAEADMLAGMCRALIPLMLADMESKKASPNKKLVQLLKP